MNIDGVPFGEIMNQAVKLKTHQAKPDRWRWDSWPKFKQNTMFTKEDVEVLTHIKTPLLKMIEYSFQSLILPQDSFQLFIMFVIDESIFNCECCVCIIITLSLKGCSSTVGLRRQIESCLWNQRSCRWYVSRQNVSGRSL
jgi:hypothetical protein